MRRQTKRIMVLALTALMALPAGEIGMRESYAAEAAAGAKAEIAAGNTAGIAAGNKAEAAAGAKTEIAAGATAEDTTAIHDIFHAKDDSKLEKFKERIYNGLLYKTPAINVADLDIRPEEIVSETALGTVSGEYGAAWLVKNHPFYSTAATIGNPTFTYKDNGCVESVKYQYHPAWNDTFIKD